MKCPIAAAMFAPAVFVALACTAPRLTRAEVLLFRGEHVYVVPRALNARLLELAPREAWRHFDEFTREVDGDDDGIPDHQAIALGAVGGYGAQIRYRLHEDVDPGGRRLGRWYWGVVTGPDGEILYEVFNP